MPRYRSQELMTGSVIASTTAPVAHIGQRWFNTATGVTYQYTIDAAGTKFWLDISSGGIGTSAARGVDYVGDTDPLPTHNGGSATLTVGQVYYNRENNKHFVCTDASNNANVWSGRYSGMGGTVTNYLDSGTYYRVHTFLSNGTFIVDGTTNVDYLVVAGGGGGGGGNSNDSPGGGGGAGGYRFNASPFSVASGTYPITVGIGGAGGVNDTSGVRGTNSVFSSIISTGGGGGGSNTVGGTGAHSDGDDGGSGGGASRGAAAGAATPVTSPVQGYAGGTGYDSSKGGGGGGANAGGTNATSTVAGAGGAGLTNVYRTGSASSYAGGGGGGASGGTAGTATHGGGVGSTSVTGGAGVANTGAGGGGGNGTGGLGGSGIVVIRYAI